MTRHGLDLLAATVLDVAAWSLRLLPVTVFSPFLGGPLLPPVARVAIALSLGAAARASAGGGVPVGASFPGVAGSELALGAALAFAATLPVEVARAAGRLVDTLRGATLGELHVAPIRQRETAVGDLLAQWTVVLGAWAGADRLLVVALLRTFQVLPVGALPGGAGGFPAALRVSAELLASAFCIGAPAAAALLCADLALAAAGRLAPRNSMLDAAPAVRAALGLLAVALPAAAIGARLVETAALAAGLVDAAAGGGR